MNAHTHIDMKSWGYGKRRGGGARVAWGESWEKVGANI